MTGIKCNPKDARFQAATAQRLPTWASCPWTASTRCYPRTLCRQSLRTSCCRCSSRPSTCCRNSPKKATPTPRETGWRRLMKSEFMVMIAIMMTVRQKGKWGTQRVSNYENAISGYLQETVSRKLSDCTHLVVKTAPLWYMWPWFIKRCFVTLMFLFMKTIHRVIQKHCIVKVYAEWFAVASVVTDSLLPEDLKVMFCFSATWNASQISSDCLLGFICDDLNQIQIFPS